MMMTKLNTMMTKLNTMMTKLNTMMTKLYSSKTLTYSLGTFLIIYNTLNSSPYYCTTIVVCCIGLYSAFNIYLDHNKVNTDNTKYNNIINKVDELSEKVDKSQLIVDSITQTLSLTSRPRGN